MGVVSKIQKTVIRVIGFRNYRKIITSFNRFVYGIRGTKWSGEDVLSVKEYSVDGKNAFFGYYDLKSIDGDGQKLLSIVTDGDTAHEADVGYFSIETGEFNKLTTTKAWNWQMGARIRWINSDQIMFNDFSDGTYISRIIDADGKEIKRFGFPLYDVDLSSMVGYYPDFVLLNLLRKGYGYENIPASIADYYNDKTQGIYKADLKSNISKLLYSLEYLKSYNPANNMDNCFHYINHISVNQQNGWLFFFHLWLDPKTDDLNNRVFILDERGNIVNVLSDFKRASHYDWYDDKHVMLTVVSKGNAEYRLYNVLDGTYDLVNGIATDGHPTVVSPRIFVTDTYPDRSAMENVYVCDLEKEKYKRVFSIYHNTKKFGEHRCDLHPRVEGNMINLDSIEGKFRKQYVICLNKSVNEISMNRNRIDLNPLRG